ncbi:hypothetical protein Hanom_Chr07g00630021 [Helianthus anomalus]
MGYGDGLGRGLGTNAMSSLRVSLGFGMVSWAGVLARRWTGLAVFRGRLSLVGLARL